MIGSSVVVGLNRVIVEVFKSGLNAILLPDCMIERSVGPSSRVTESEKMTNKPSSQEVRC